MHLWWSAALAESYACEEGQRVTAGDRTCGGGKPLRAGRATGFDHMARANTGIQPHTRGHEPYSTTYARAWTIFNHRVSGLTQNAYLSPYTTICKISTPGYHKCAYMALPEYMWRAGLKAHHIWDCPFS
ncbi:hypothetical protein C8F01DRAFT_1089933 [Mycena amicta]|nr:hypothetical protein C8F01DRAFT_1089933 [Mycena amicta]